jgi:outer membrane protein OmpA-like peptidoglycan-associated protein
MKIKILPVFLIIAILFSLPVYSKDRNGSLKAIEQAENSLKTLDSLNDIKQYIPSDIYNEAVVNIINARTQWDKSEYLSAYYLATVAYIKLEAAKNFSSAKDNKNKKIMLELEFYKKHPAGNIVNKINAVLNSGLNRKAEFFTISIMDKNLFRGNDFKLSDEGINKLSRIIEVIKLFPECTVKIAGHSSSFDYKAYTKFKAEAVLKYIISSGISSKSITSVGIGNIEVMETPVGYKRLDRVEIIISGIKF